MHTPCVRMVCGLPIYSTERITMAKGQLRSNREARKPKKEKGPAVTPPAFGSQVKGASDSLSLGKKQK